MALNFQQHRRRIMLLTGNRIDNVRAGEVINVVLQEVWTSWTWSFRKKEALLTTVAPYSTGTVSAVSSTVLQGASTVWTSAMVNRYIRIGSDVAFYKITAVDTGLQRLTLETAYAGTITAGSTYTIFQHLYSLASDVDIAATLSYWRKLRETSIERRERADARRSYQSSYPWEFLYRGEDSSGNVQVELSPVPSAAIAVRYHYLSTAPQLVQGTDDNTRIALDEDVLNYKGAALALMIYLAEHPEIPGATTLAALNSVYEKKGEAALADAQFADLKKAGASDAVRDDAEDLAIDDEWLWDRDYMLP